MGGMGLEVGENSGSGKGVYVGTLDFSKSGRSYAMAKLRPVRAGTRLNIH